MSTLIKYLKEIDEVCIKVRRTVSRETVDAPDGAEIYGYPRTEGRTAWGVNGPNGGQNLLRGIRLPDGRDTEVH